MSQFKNPKLRYKTLDKCFRNTAKKYFIEDLVDECNKALQTFGREYISVSKRQVWDDIKFMKSNEGWQIELEQFKLGKRTYYRYIDPSFSIEKMPLTEVDFNQLKSAMQILACFEGMPQFDWLDEMTARIQYLLPDKDRRKPFISFDNNQYLHGVEYLGRLFNAISYKQVLRVSYQDFKSHFPYEVIIHPYFLKEYNNRWFLFGLNPDKGKSDWTLALDRIKNIDEISNENYKESEVQWNEYFQNIIGVTKPLNLLESQVILHFYGPICKYVLSKPLHGSQKTKFLQSEILEVRLELIMNYELEQVILSFGDKVQVISPVGLVKKVSLILANSISRYNNKEEY
jgi:predicted DNA-binding transcriptional regulator YafY